MGEGERTETMPGTKRKRGGQVTTEDLLSEDAILAMSLPLGQRAFCGIYFLILDDEIVYVGSSINLLARLSTHLAERKMRFNRISFVICAEADVRKTEYAYIRTLKPLYNNFSGADALKRRLAFRQERAKPDDEAYVLTRAEATTYLENRGIVLGEYSLGAWAHRKKGPKYYLVPHGAAVYLRKDLDAWVDRMLNGKVAAA